MSDAWASTPSKCTLNPLPCSSNTSLNCNGAGRVDSNSQPYNRVQWCYKLILIGIARGEGFASHQTRDSTKSDRHPLLLTDSFKNCTYAANRADPREPNIQKQFTTSEMASSSRGSSSKQPSSKQSSSKGSSSKAPKGSSSKVSTKYDPARDVSTYECDVCGQVCQTRQGLGVSIPVVDIL